MKNIFLALAMMLIVGNSWGQNYQSFDASASNALTTSKWSASSGTNACVSTGLSNAFTSGRIAYFCTANGTGSGSVGITVGGIIATENYTHSSPSSTLATGGTVATVNVSSGKVFNIAGAAISTAAGTGFIKSGAGAFLMTGAAFTSGFTLSAGTMLLGGANAMGNGGSLTLNGGTIAATTANRDLSGKYSSITIGGDIQFGDVGANFSTITADTRTLTFSDAMALGSGVRTFTMGNSGSTTLSGVISGSGGINYTANSNGMSGSFILSTGNTYTGKTSLTAGIVSGSGESMLGANPGSFVADQITFNGGTLLSTAAMNFSSNRGITLSTNGGYFNTTSGNITLTNVVTGSGSLIKIGTGTLIFAGSHTYTGTTKDSVGTIQLNAANLFPNTSALNISSGASFDMKGFSDTLGSIAGAGSITSSAAGTIVLTNGGDNTSTSFSGIISNGTATSLAITKIGTGTLILTGSNTYTGATTVSAGTLRLNKSGGTTLATTQSVSVSNSAILQISSNQSLTNVTLASGATLTVDASTTLTITGTLTIAAGAIVNGSGSIAYSSGALVYNGTGSLTAGIEWPTTAVPASVTIGATDTILLAATRTTTITLTVNGVLNAATFSITGTGTVNINGILITSNLNGFAGTGATFTGATPTLGASSTVEYAASSGTQVITTSPSYINLTLSSGGIKTASSSLSISGTLTISGTTVFNASNSTIGGSGTNLTMTGSSKYILAGTGTRPNATGTYTLAATSTIEFSNTANTQQDIRLSPTYGNIDISGTNVGLSSTSSSLTLQNGSTFTVKSGGIFNVINSNGFAGISNTAVSSNNSPTITLASGSTINFSSSSAQNINARTFSKVYITGGSTKTLTGDITVSDSLKITSGKLAIAGNTLTLAGTISSDATNSLVGSNASKLSITNTSNVGTVYFDQTTSADVTVTTGTNALQNLVVTGAGGIVTLGNKINLFEKLNIKNSSTLNTGDYLVLRSIAGTSSNNTAYIDSVGGTISGQVTVEKYIHKAARGWRALTAPITYNGITQGYVSSNWQSDFGLGNNYGTRITGSVTGGGLDDLTPSSSLQTYNSTAGAWTKVTNTTTETQSGNAANASNKSFFIFIRGDRTVTPTSSTPNAFVSTTLAAKGKLQTGTQTFAFTGVANKSWLVGNPYACTVDMSSITYSNIGQFVYVWDPNLTGSSTNTTGGYATFDRNTWGAATAGASTKYFQSGQAFFIKPTSATASIVFNENNKATANQNNQVTGTVNGLSDIFNIKLLNVKADGTKTEVDGVRAKYGVNYSADVDEDDATKFASSIENISLNRNGKSLVIEARPNIATTDSLFINMTAMNEGANYEFSINPINFDASVTSCKLVDNFLNTEKSISLTSFTTVDFNVTSVAGSNAVNRFYIVFNTAAVLANNEVKIKAYKNNKNVVVNWEVSAENNVKYYVVEKSIDGMSFSKLAETKAMNDNTTNSYEVVDNAAKTINFYRIKIIQLNDNIRYSSIVKIALNENPIKGFTVYPNPVKGNSLNVQLNNMETGNYAAKLFNIVGNLVEESNINHNGNNASIKLQFNNKISAGNYQLQLTDIKGNAYKQSVLVVE